MYVTRASLVRVEILKQFSVGILLAVASPQSNFSPTKVTSGPRNQVMKYVVGVLCVFILLQVTVHAKTYYVAPLVADLTACDEHGIPGACGPGNASNTGAINSPWTLSKACGPAGARADDIVYLRGGRYTGFKFVCTASGTTGHPVTFRSYLGPDGDWTGMSDNEWAIIDGYYTTSIGSNDIANAADCSFTLTDGTFFPVNSVILVGDNQSQYEQINITSKSGPNAVTGCLRGYSFQSYSGNTRAHASGQTVMLQGNQMVWDVGSHDIILRDFQITNSWKERNFTNFVGRGEGIFVYAQRFQAINLVIDNNEDGIFTSDSVCDDVIYGNIVFNNGNVGSDRGHGHGLYLHNSAAGCTLEASRNIILNSYGLGMQVYGVRVSVRNFTADRNISFGNGQPATYPESPCGTSCSLQSNLLSGSENGVTVDSSFTNNYLYQKPDAGVSGGVLSLHIGTATGSGNTVTGNYIVGGFPLFTSVRQTSFRFTGNTLINAGPTTSGQIYQSALSSADSKIWDGNSIYDMRQLQSGSRQTFSLPSSDIAACCQGHLGGGLFEFTNTTTLRAAITRTSACDSGPNKISLSSAENIRTSNVIVIGAEEILVSGKAGNDITSCTRGFNHTIAATHSNGATVGMIYSGAPTTTLNGAIGTSVCSSRNIVLADGTGFGVNATFKIDLEQIKILARSGNNITDCTRGFNGTLAASHDDGASVRHCSSGACNTPVGTGWTSWSQGLDMNTRYVAGSLPTSTFKTCINNAYETGRGYCPVFNWERTSTVSLDLSELGFSNNDTYAIWDSQYFTPWTTESAIVTGTYDGRPVTVPFSALTRTTPPIGSSFTPPNLTQNAQAKFTAYIVRKTGSGR